MTVREWVNANAENNRCQVYSRKEGKIVEVKATLDEKVLSMRGYKACGDKAFDCVLQIK